MDFKSLLQTMSTISEGEKTTTEKGTVHKGEYGNKYGKEDVRDQYGHKVGRSDKGAEAKKDAPKKGRGRPKKDTGDAGEKFDTSALSSVFGGKKPKKEIGKVSKKHSLKEYMESVEDTKNAEAVMEGMFGGVDHTSVAANLGKLARVIKSVQTPEQFAVAQKYAQRMKGTIMKHQHDNSGFGSGLRANLGVMRDVDADLKAKATELGIDYVPLEETGTGQAPVEIKPASQTNTQVIQQGDKTLGTVNNPQLAAQIKQSIGKGEMSLTGDDTQQMNEVDPMNYDSDEDYYDAVRDSRNPYSGMSEDEMKDELARFKSNLRRETNSSLRSYYANQISKLENILWPEDDYFKEGKDEGKPGKNFAKIAKSAGEKYGSKAAGERVAGAVRNKLKAQGKLEESDKAKKDYDGDGKIESGKAEHKGAVTKAINKALGKDVKKVDESRDHESSEYLDEKVAKILAREKPGMDTVKSNDAFYGAVYNELIACGLTPKAARYKVSYDEDFISDVASAYAHYQKNPALDEGDINPRDSSSIQMHRQHALAEPTNNFRTQGQEPGSMAAPRGSRTEINRPVPNPTPWGTDPIAAATDRAFNFVSSLGKGTKFTKEGTNMKDIQLESWSKQLNGLLSEGITVSSSQGQQGAPDSVSITATDNDAQSLMSVLRNAGIGGFGAEQPAPEIGYGVAQGGEEEPTGTGTEPQAAPDVVGDDGDMLSMLKKMAGLEGGDAEVVAVSGGDEEAGQDYENEEGSDETALQPADSSDEEEQDSNEESDEEGDDEEQTDEGNAFTGKLKQTPQGDEFKMGDKSYKDTSSIEEGEHTCNECGMMESSCECETEQVEEAYANEADQELASLKALLAMGNDLHSIKRNQTVGNPTQVSMAESLADWKKLSGIK